MNYRLAADGRIEDTMAYNVDTLNATTSGECIACGEMIEYPYRTGGDKEFECPHCHTHLQTEILSTFLTVEVGIKIID